MKASLRQLRLLAIVCTLYCRIASAEKTGQLIVTLDTPEETIPELFCVIGSQRCDGSHCHALAEIDDAMVPSNDGTIAFDAKRLKHAFADASLQAAVTSMSRIPGGCEQCRPSMQFVDEMQSMPAAPGHTAGFIACARNSRPTRSDRVVLTYLKFNLLATTAVPLKEVTLMGNQATVNFRMDLDMAAYEFMLGIGGDYLEDTTGLGTKERMVLRLNPRCTLDPIRVPGRIPALNEHRSVTLDGASADQCIVESNGGMSAWLPHRLSPATSKLQLNFVHAGSSQAREIYEAIWTEAAPPQPLRIQERRVEFAWRKDCLAGTLPVTDNNDGSWNATCPKATLPQAGAKCVVEGSVGVCNYRCDAPPTMPAFDLPTPVHFERYGKWNEIESRLAYDWTDTLGYAGQELSSFVAAADRTIIVEFPAPEAWQSHYGNEFDRVDLRIDAQGKRSIPIGVRAPPWVAIPAPNASCSSRVAIDVVGSRSFAPKEQSLESSPSSGGNLVLSAPQHYRDLFHWTAGVGLGLMTPLNDKIGGFRGEPHISTSAGFELYFARPFSGAFEFNIHYEPTFTAYGAVGLTPREGTQLITVPYHRGAATIGATIWGEHREWQAGLMAGPGIGGPIFGAVEKVGAIRLFGFAGGFYRYRPSSLPAWLEFRLGLRWGEHHEYFGTDATGAAVANTFHGEPPLTERALLQAYGAVQCRMVFK